ncbi:hypothetical protein F2Q68_00020519 [Brassica cretica]|uniref:Uncharacterized protein n=1 Tax=Brassica cretica TaxID=69181 RepID=A0A8S9G3D9_BRACR|nr:hypothetical protein F2Q68_00020519 [Brassica cretica]
MFSQFLSHITSGIVTENQKNTTVTDQNTISLSLSDESKSTALSDSVDNSPQLISMVLTKRDPMVSRLSLLNQRVVFSRGNFASDDDDDMDLFGDETEEEKKAAEKRETAKKPKENDMKKLGAAVRCVEMHGLLWGAYLTLVLVLKLDGGLNHYPSPPCLRRHLSLSRARRRSNNKPNAVVLVVVTDDDDDMDLFGDETEEEKKAAEERETAKKPKENDMKKLGAAVRCVEMHGLLWGASVAAKLVPFVTVSKKLTIMLS